MRPDLPDLQIADSVIVAGRTVSSLYPLCGLRLFEGLGLLVRVALSGQVVHRTPAPEIPLFETRCAITPGGDLLMMFPQGGHYVGKNEKVNDLLAYRSYDQHGFIPLVPRRSRPNYTFGTQSVWGLWSTQHGLGENAPIGYRYSEDDGIHWREARITCLLVDPRVLGISVMRMNEIDSGAWILGAHEGDWSYKPLITRQYILHSADQGKTWIVGQHPRHNGWYVHSHNCMDEGRPINLGNDEVFLLLRSPAGQHWSTRTVDDGMTWENPAPHPVGVPRCSAYAYPPVGWQDPVGTSSQPLFRCRLHGVGCKKARGDERSFRNMSIALLRRRTDLDRASFSTGRCPGGIFRIPFTQLPTFLYRRVSSRWQTTLVNAASLAPGVTPDLVGNNLKRSAHSSRTGLSQPATINC
ncbi:MAG TPA: sialidase family protein [Anaerolineaceae bacterium]